jgi:hypothetical protein
MSENTDNSKEQIIAIIGDQRNKLQEIETLKQQIEDYSKSLFADVGDKKSIKSQIENLITNFNTEKESATQLKNDLINYKSELFDGLNGGESVKSRIDNLLKENEELKDSLEKNSNEINAFYKLLFTDEEGGVSYKTQLASFISDFNKEKEELNKIKLSFTTYKSELLDGSKDNESLKTKIENLLTHFETSKVTFDKQSKDFTTYYESLFVDAVESNSIKTEIEKIKNQFTENLNDNTSKLNELKGFYSTVFEKATTDKGETKDGLKATTEGIVNKCVDLTTQLQKLISDANEKLFALTDSALHTGFAKRAKGHSDEYDKLQNYTTYSVLAICGVTLLFGITQVILVMTGKGFNSALEIFQLGITLPLVYIAWMYNRNQKIAKKLAEEYHHKSSLSEAMTGYRNLYSLKHDSPEYLSLFNDIKKQLNINPSTKIDKFLNLKSPQEAIIDRATDLINAETLPKIVEVVMLLKNGDSKQAKNQLEELLKNNPEIKDRILDIVKKAPTEEVLN